MTLQVCVLLAVLASVSGFKYKLGLHPPAINEVVRIPPDQWFEQKLDHFQPTDERTWKQRYFTNSSFFDARRNGPVFLMIGGEGPASPLWMVKGAWIDYAQQYGALCFQLEHRFYGKSHPTQDMSVENLRYLSSEQALADLANFIQAMNKEHRLKGSNKWVVFGGSYPGSLAAWARLKYPHLIHAAVSTSGPLLAKADFREYFDVVRNSLDTVDNDCSDAVHESIKSIGDLLLTQEGRSVLSKKLQLCTSLENYTKKDLSTLYEAISDLFAGVVQYNKDNRFTTDATSNITINDVCLIMTDYSLGEPLDRLAYYNNMLLRRQNELCLDYSYDNMVGPLKVTSWLSEAAAGGRQWIYQTCTEFGFYQTSSSDEDLFGSLMTTEYFINQCKDIYGDKFNTELLNEGIERTNNMYGALHTDVSRVVFVHGSIDPWHALGKVHSAYKNRPAIYIQGTAHCANMYPASKHDPPQLTEARWKIKRLIGRWLSDNDI